MIVFDRLHRSVTTIFGKVVRCNWFGEYFGRCVPARGFGSLNLSSSSCYQTDKTPCSIMFSLSIIWKQMKVSALHISFSITVLPSDHAMLMCVHHVMWPTGWHMIAHKQENAHVHKTRHKRQKITSIMKNRWYIAQQCQTFSNWWAIQTMHILFSIFCLSII